MSEPALRTRDGVTLAARFDPPTTAAGAAPASPAFVVTHGFTGSWRRPDVRAVVDVLRERGPVLSYDLRGHGTSGGLSTVGAVEDEDLRAAVTWLRDPATGPGRARVVSVGFSLGASVAVRHAGLHGGVDAVVAVSGPSRWNYRGTVPMRRLHLGMLTRPGRAVLAVRFGTRVGTAGWDPPPLPPDTLAGRIAPVPLLVVHGDADHYFPLDHARWLVAAAGPAATLWVEPGMGHAEKDTSPDLARRIAEWSVTAASGAAPVPAPPSVRMPP